MVGCRLRCLRCLRCLFACSSLLLLAVCLNGTDTVSHVEASSCQKVTIHKRVGDTVEMSSCLPTEGVTDAKWRTGNSVLADKDTGLFNISQFKDRLYLNPANFSLTVRKLTVEDSGDYMFVSEVTETQRETVTVTLRVHEPITEQPVMISNSTWHNENESCTVLLECRATTGNVGYNWTVGNQTRSGPMLRHVIRLKDGDAKFTCTIYNFVSEMSEFKIVKCSNETQEKGLENFVYFASAIGGGCLLILILLIIVCVCYCRRTQPGSDMIDHTVYADITEVANEPGTTKPCSLYETIENRVQSVTPGPQTVYDQIQLSRVRKQSVSPYQDVS